MNNPTILHPTIMDRIVYQPRKKPAKPKPAPPAEPTPTTIVKNRKPKGLVGLTRYWPEGPRFGFYYAVASFPLMAAGVLGPDLFPVSLEAKALAFYACLGLAFFFLLIGTFKELQVEAVDHLRRGHRRRMIAIGGMLICGMGFIGFTGAYFWPSKEAQNAAKVATFPPSEVTSQQVSDLRKLNSWIGGKDEIQLRKIFDIDNIERNNILMIKEKLLYASVGAKFDFLRYAKIAGPTIIAPSIARLYKIPDGIKFDYTWIPPSILFLLCSLQNSMPILKVN